MGPGAPRIGVGGLFIGADASAYQIGPSEQTPDSVVFVRRQVQPPRPDSHRRGGGGCRGGADDGAVAFSKSGVPFPSGVCTEGPGADAAMTELSLPTALGDDTCA
jgi:hypothetical protein